MKESEKRLRLKVVEYVLQHLTELSGARFVKKEIFALPEHEMRNSDLRDAAAPASWQKSLIERFLKNGVLTKHQDAPGTDVYYTANSVLAHDILMDHKKGGLVLSWFVFPSEVSLTTKAGETAPNLVEGDEGEGGDEDEEAAPVEHQRPYEALTEEDIKKLDHVSDRDLAVRHFALLYEIANTQNSILNSLNKIAAALVATSHKVDTATKAQDLSGLDEGIKAVKNKTNTLQAHQQEMLAVLNAVARKVSSKDYEEKGVTASEVTEAVQGALSEMTFTLDDRTLADISAAIVTGANHTIAATTQGMAEVLKAVNAKEEDRIGHALKQIADMKRNMTAIEDLLTEHMVKS